MAEKNNQNSDNLKSSKNSAQEEVVIASTEQEVFQQQQEALKHSDDITKEDKDKAEAGNAKVKKKKRHKKKIDFIIYVSLLTLLFSLLFVYLAYIENGKIQVEHEKQLDENAKVAIETNAAVITKRLKGYSDKFLNSSITEIAEEPMKFAERFYPGTQIDILISPLNHSEIVDNAKQGYAFLDMLISLKSASDKISGFEQFKPGTENRNFNISRLLIEENNDPDSYVLLTLPETMINELFKGLNFSEGYVSVTQGSSSKVTIYSSGSIPTINNKRISRPLLMSKWILNYQYPITQVKFSPMTFILLIIYLVIAVLLFILTIIIWLKTLRKHMMAKKLQAMQDSNTLLSKDNISQLSASNAGVLVDITKDNKQQQNDREILPEHIFTEHGVRGQVNKDITEDSFNVFGQAIANELESIGQTTIVVGYDQRPGSEKLADSLMQGLLHENIDVIDIGQTITPLLYFAAEKKAQGNGLMVTAGRAGADYNGIKVLINHELYGKSKLQGLLLSDLDFTVVDSQKKANAYDPLPVYLESVKQQLNIADKVKIIVDAANGPIAQVLQTLFKDTKCELVVINEKLDGTFPDHLPDPSKPENLSSLIERVRSDNADLGISFNSDASALGVVSAKGEIIWADRVLMFLASDIIKRNPGKKVLFDVKSSSTIHDYVVELQGEPEMTPSGYVQLKERMDVHGALLAGEFAGHIFINDGWTKYDDAIYVMIKLLNLVAQKNNKKTVFSEIPEKISTPEILLPVQPGQLEGIMSKILVQKDEFKNAGLITLDGLRVEYENGWGVIRASKSINALSLRIEADSPEALQKIAEKIKEVVLSVVFVKFPY